MGCSECLALGPPPSGILLLPPPPLPEFARALPPNRTGACAAFGVCAPSALGASGDSIVPDVEYRELPRHDPAAGGDTWYLVLITCCVAVLCLAALLALFLLKCRDEGPVHKQGAASLDAGTLAPGKREPFGGLDSRVLWAALTPRGTQHFVADHYPQDPNTDPYRDDNQYETIESLQYKVALPEKFAYPQEKIVPHEKTTFENNGFLDYDYEDPAPLIESYQLDEMEARYAADVNPYCVNQLPHDMGSMRRGISRPLVSSPTRIEHPNLPPLNLYPLNRGTLRENSHTRRVSDTNGCGGNLVM